MVFEDVWWFSKIIGVFNSQSVFGRPQKADWHVNSDDFQKGFYFVEKLSSSRPGLVDFNSRFEKKERQKANGHLKSDKKSTNFGQCQF